MTEMKRIKEHMEVIGADGVDVGTVDRVETTVSSSRRSTVATVATKVTTTISTEVSWPRWKVTRFVSPYGGTSRLWGQRGGVIIHCHA